MKINASGHGNTAGVECQASRSHHYRNAFKKHPIPYWEIPPPTPTHREKINMFIRYHVLVSASPDSPAAPPNLLSTLPSFLVDDIALRTDNRR